MRTPSPTDFANLARLIALLTLVAVLSTAHRQLTRTSLPLKQMSPLTSIFACTIEAIQLLIATQGCTKLLADLSPVVHDSDFSLSLRVVSTAVRLASNLALYSSAVLALDWIDASIASNGFQTTFPSPFMLTRAMLLGREHIWVLEPAPLPPWPGKQSIRPRRRHQGSRPDLERVSHRIPQYEFSAHDRLSGQHITFARNVPAFSSGSQPAEAPDIRKVDQTIKFNEHNEAADRAAEHPAVPLTPPDSRQGLVRSKIKALSTFASPAASPLAAKARTV